LAVGAKVQVDLRKGRDESADLFIISPIAHFFMQIRE
jgi:hypothetical protein